MKLRVTLATWFSRVFFETHHTCRPQSEGFGIENLPDDLLALILGCVARSIKDENEDRRLNGSLLSTCSRFQRLLLPFATRVVIESQHAPRFPTQSSACAPLPPLHMCLPIPFPPDHFDGCSDSLTRVSRLSFAWDALPGLGEHLEQMTALCRLDCIRSDGDQCFYCAQTPCVFPSSHTPVCVAVSASLPIYSPGYPEALNYETTAILNRTLSCLSCLTQLNLGW